MNSHEQALAQLASKTTPLIGASMYLQEANSIARSIYEDLRKAEEDRNSLRETLDQIVLEHGNGEHTTLNRMAELKSSINQAQTKTPKPDSGTPQ